MPRAPDLVRLPATAAPCCTAFPTAATDAFSADGVTWMASSEPWDHHSHKYAFYATR